MISRTHIQEIIGLSDAFDEGDIIKFEFEAPARFRASSIPSSPSTGPLNVTATVNFTGVLRPSDNTLYLFTLVIGEINDTHYNDVLYSQNKSSVSGFYIEAFVPQKISICTNTSTTEIDMNSVISNNVIGQYARAVLKKGTKPIIEQSIIFDKHTSYRLDDDYWISRANWSNLGPYKGNYIRYKITFDNASVLQYFSNNPNITGYFKPVKPTKPYMVEGFQVSRNVLK